jgi:RNA polymerase sigma factor (sigma-70 family)
MSDQEYLEGIRNDNPVAQKDFYENYKDIVKGVVYKYDGSGEIRFEDHYQDVMMIVWSKIKNGELSKLTAKLSTYLYRVAYNLLLHKMRKTGKNVPLEGIEIQAESDGPDLDKMEMLALELVDDLRPPCNEIIADWYLNQLSYEEIAEKHKYKNANTAKKKKGDCLTKARAVAEELLKSQEI